MKEEYLVKILKPELFEKYPVWIWDESNEYKCPLRTNFLPLPEDKGVLFIKAIFEDNLKREFDGYLVGYESYHAFGVFTKNGTYTFNFNLPSFMEEDLKDIYPNTELTVNEFFPVKYKSELFFEGKPPISGTFLFEIPSLSEE